MKVLFYCISKLARLSVINQRQIALRLSSISYNQIVSNIHLIRKFNSGLYAILYLEQLIVSSLCLLTIITFFFRLYNSLHASDSWFRRAAHTLEEPYTCSSQRSFYMKEIRFLPMYVTQTWDVITYQLKRKLHNGIKC